MAVVNCKVTFIRPSYASLKHWMEDPSNVYIGRKGIVFVDKERWPKKDSPWSNPFKIGPMTTREEVIIKYESWIREKLAEDPERVEELLALKGKNLGCWCAPEQCHGHVLLKLIAEFDNR